MVQNSVAFCATLPCRSLPFPALTMTFAVSCATLLPQQNMRLEKISSVRTRLKLALPSAGCLIGHTRWKGRRCLICPATIHTTYHRTLYIHSSIHRTEQLRCDSALIWRRWTAGLSFFPPSDGRHDEHVSQPSMVFRLQTPGPTPNSAPE